MSRDILAKAAAYFYTAVRRAQIRKGVRKLAATRLIALHQNKGKSVAACLKSRTDYAQNPEKTAGGALVSKTRRKPPAAHWSAAMGAAR